MTTTTFTSGTTITSSWLNDVNNAVYTNVLSGTNFGMVSDGSDQTTRVQTAINSLGANGGLIQIPRNCKFNLQSLNFQVASFAVTPGRVNLEFWMDDDLSRPNPLTTLGTNERVIWCANANSGGIVNEWRYTGAFNPGLILDVRDDVTGQQGSLGGGSLNPTKSTFGLFSQQLAMWDIQLQKYSDSYTFSGILMRGYRNKVVLTGVGSSDGGWTVPTVGTVISGVTSLAKGYVISIAAGSTTVIWISGKFVTGEKIKNVTNSTGTITPTFTQESLNPLVTSWETGNWSVGLPNNSSTAAFAVGGEMQVMPSRSGVSQYLPYTITNPAVVWSDSIADVPTDGFKLIYDTVPAAAARRMWWTKYTSSTKLGPTGLMRAKTAFTNAAAKETSNVNVATLSRTAVGKYTITFTNAFARADYAVSIGNNNINDSSRYINLLVGSVDIWNYDTATRALADLVGEVSVICTGGDI